MAGSLARARPASQGMHGTRPRIAFRRSVWPWNRAAEAPKSSARTRTKNDELQTARDHRTGYRSCGHRRSLYDRDDREEPEGRKEKGLRRRQQLRWGQQFGRILKRKSPMKAKQQKGRKADGRFKKGHRIRGRRTGSRKKSVNRKKGDR